MTKYTIINGEVVEIEIEDYPNKAKVTFKFQMPNGVNATTKFLNEKADITLKKLKVEKLFQKYFWQISPHVGGYLNDKDEISTFIKRIDDFNKTLSPEEQLLIEVGGI